MRASGSDRQGRGFFGELMAAWIVVIVVIAIGLAVASFHESGTSDGVLPHWYDPQVAGVQPPEDEALAPDERRAMSRPTEEEICDMIANEASPGRPPASGSSADQSGMPC